MVIVLLIIVIDGLSVLKLICTLNFYNISGDQEAAGKEKWSDWGRNGSDGTPECLCSQHNLGHRGIDEVRKMLFPWQYM